MIRERSAVRAFRLGLALACAASLATLGNCSRGGGTPAPAPSPNPSPFPVVQKGARQLGLDILHVPSSGSFAQNMTAALSVGAQAFILPISWSADEPTTASDCSTAGTYSDSGGVLGTFNSLLPGSGLKVAISFPVTNTNILDVPSNLTATAFDGVTADTNLLACRFNLYLTWVQSQAPDLPLASIAIGNELSNYLAGQNSATAVAFWGSYWSFLSQVMPHARSLWPGVPVSVTDTLYGVLGTDGNSFSQGGMQQLLGLADYLSLTYYPVTTGYAVEPTSIVATDLAAAVAAYPNLPVRVQEVGFPSDSQNDASSPSLQAAFVTAVFRAWDQNPTRIAYLNFVRYSDLTYPQAQGAASPYGVGTAPFIAFLQTLGLVGSDGSPKAGFAQLQAETSARGW